MDTAANAGAMAHRFPPDGGHFDAGYGHLHHMGHRPGAAVEQSGQDAGQDAGQHFPQDPGQ